MSTSDSNTCCPTFSLCCPTRPTTSRPSSPRRHIVTLPKWGGSFNKPPPEPQRFAIQTQSAAPYQVQQTAAFISPSQYQPMVPQYPQTVSQYPQAVSQYSQAVSQYPQTVSQYPQTVCQFQQVTPQPQQPPSVPKVSEASATSCLVPSPPSVGPPSGASTPQKLFDSRRSTPQTPVPRGTPQQQQGVNDVPASQAPQFQNVPFYIGHGSIHPVRSMVFESLEGYLDIEPHLLEVCANPHHAASVYYKSLEAISKSQRLRDLHADLVKVFLDGHESPHRILNEIVHLQSDISRLSARIRSCLHYLHEVRHEALFAEEKNEDSRQKVVSVCDGAARNLIRALQGECENVERICDFRLAVQQTVQQQQAVSVEA